MISPKNKIKLFNILMLLTSLFGYMEWGGGNKAFLYESETEVFKGLGTDPASLIHPLVLLPLLGQLLLLITLFQHNPGKWLTYAGMISLSLLLGIILFIGILESNSRMLWSTIPFFMSALGAIWARNSMLKN